MPSPLDLNIFLISFALFIFAMTITIGYIVEMKRQKDLHENIEVYANNMAQFLQNLK